MGSKSDWEVMQHAAQQLEDLKVTWEAQAISAHRAPDALFEYLSTAIERGLEVIIAAAGGAAHLPGVCAAKTSLPVLVCRWSHRHSEASIHALDCTNAGRRSGRDAGDRQTGRDQCGAAGGAILGLKYPNIGKPTRNSAAGRRPTCWPTAY